MIVRREKMRKELHRTSMDVFYKQNDILLDECEDLSGDNLDFIRHRTTKFCNFSENYQTENQYESEYGTKISIYDSTLEESLLNTSQMEMLNPNDFERGATSSTSCVDNSNKNLDLKTTDSERNIFELFVPKSIVKTDTPSDIKKEDLRTVTTAESINDTKKNVTEQKNVFDKISNLISREICKNGFIDVSSNSQPKPGENGETNPLPNNCLASKKSSLVKRGKRRFRNLHDIEGCSRRNSPRLRKFENTDTVVDSIATNSINLSDIISETKKRRLKSVDSYASEYNGNHSDYVRLTRSRVSSCS